MTDREWRASHCLACYPPPDHCTDCPCHEMPSAGTKSESECETMGARKTAPDECANTPEGLTTQTGLES